MSRVLLRRDANVLRRSYLKGAVGTPARAMFDDTAGAGSSLLIRGQYDPSLELNYVDDPRLACGEVFTRATIRTLRDFEGRTLTLNSGEVGFWGMRRVENLLDFTEDATNAYWTKDDITVEANVSSQPGGVSSAPKADKLVETAANSDHRLQPTGLGSVVGRSYVSSFRVKAAERSACAVQVNGLANSTAIFDLATATVTSTQSAVAEAGASAAGDGFVRVWIRWVSANAAQYPELALVAAGATTYAGSPGWGLYFRQCQHQDVTGQSYLGPSEYVSKRVLVAPYQGANVDGVRYFVTDYYGVVIPRYTGDTIKYHQTTGITGEALAPDFAAARITGAISLRAQVNINTLSSGSTQVFIGKDDFALQRCYHFGINGANAFIFVYTPDGNTARQATCNVTTGFQNGATGWGRADYDPDSGNVTFYTSRDYNPDTLRGTWTQLGAIQVLTAGAIFAGTATLRAGRLVGGLLFRAQIFSVGADNAPVLISDFNPNLAAAAGSASFVASTGETWTVQNNGTIGRINTFTKNARMGLFRERAGTNLQIRSDALDDATYTKTRATATANTISGVDGSLIGDKLVEDASAAATHIVQDTALVKAASALAYTFTATLRAGERSAARLDLFSGANGAFARFDLLLGTVLTAGTLVGAGFAGASAVIVQCMPGVYCCSLTVTSDATAALQSQIGLYNAADAYNGDGVSGLFVLAQQIEQSDHATSYIPTAAVAVTRNVEVITLATSTTWYNSAEGVLAISAIPNALIASMRFAVLDDGTLNERVSLFNSGGQPSVLIANGGVTQANLVASALVAGSRFYCAGGYKVNDFTLTANASAIASDVAGTVPAAATTLCVGNQSTAGNEFEGTIGRVHYFPRRIPDALLPAILATV